MHSLPHAEICRTPCTPHIDTGLHLADVSVYIHTRACLLACSSAAGARLVAALYGQARDIPASIFDLGISPYINASIVMQLLLVMPPALMVSRLHCAATGSASHPS